MYNRIMKRLIDITVAALLLLLLAPLLLITGILVKLESAGPVFFAQERIGKGGNIFRLIKFRSMTHRKRDIHQEIIGKNPEVTLVGSFIRRFKIDELPQLFNVLIGHMSLVGPRPWLPEDPLIKGGFGLKRQQVCPGLTGLAQINGNIHLTKEERLSYDLQYVDRLSFALDVTILFKTIAVVFLGEANFLNKSNA